MGWYKHLLVINSPTFAMRKTLNQFQRRSDTQMWKNGSPLEGGREWTEMARLEPIKSLDTGGGGGGTDRWRWGGCSGWGSCAWARPPGTRTRRCPAPPRRGSRAGTQTSRRCNVIQRISAVDDLSAKLYNHESRRRSYSWLKAATTTFTFKTLLRQYAKQNMHSK